MNLTKITNKNIGGQMPLLKILNKKLYRHMEFMPILKSLLGETFFGVQLIDSLFIGKVCMQSGLRKLVLPREWHGCFTSMLMNYFMIRMLKNLTAVRQKCLKLYLEKNSLMLHFSMTKYYPKVLVILTRNNLWLLFIKGHYSRFKGGWVSIYYTIFYREIPQ